MNLWRYLQQGGNVTVSVRLSIAENMKKLSSDFPEAFYDCRLWAEPINVNVSVCRRFI